MLRRLRRIGTSASRREKPFFIVVILVFCAFFIIRHFTHDIKLDAAPVEVELTTVEDVYKPVMTEDFVAAILVVCATRAEALRNHLTQLLAKRPSASQFPVVISQDGENGAVRTVAREFVNSSLNVTFMRHKQERPPKGKKRNNYASIAAHYKWALDRMFVEFHFTHVLITEDDLDIGNDFFSYFSWAKRVLDADKSTWCASAWNDNGLAKLIDDTRTDHVWRTDFFPGLGWLLSAELWAELSEKWPAQYWDDWMRTPEIRKGRSCIRPEASRTAHNMKLAGKGSSGGLYKSFLSSISASKTNTDFALVPVDTVISKNYDRNLINEIKDTMIMDINNVDSYQFDSTHSYRIPFNTVREWWKIANQFGLMVDIRGGMQRTAYYGVVPLFYRGCRIYVVPQETSDVPETLTNYTYDPLWDKQYRFLEFEKTYCKPGKWTGKCDPKNPEMIAWFTKKNWKKRLLDWGDMIVV